MSESIEHPAELATARYELALSMEEAQQGVTKILTRNGKKVQVVVPAGVGGGSVVKLSNALQLTDGLSGDILIQINIKMPEFTRPEPKFEGVIPISDSDFDSQVLQSALPVVVDFWAPWCGPCRMMSPVMDEAAIKYRGKFKFCKINVDENQQSAARYKAMSIPLLIFFKGGQVVDQSLGAIPAAQLRAKLDSLL